MNIDYKVFRKNAYYLAIFTMEDWNEIYCIVYTKIKGNFSELQKIILNCDNDDCKNRITESICIEQMKELDKYKVINQKHEIEAINDIDVPSRLVGRMIKVIDDRIKIERKLNRLI